MIGSGSEPGLTNGIQIYSFLLDFQFSTISWKAFGLTSNLLVSKGKMEPNELERSSFACLFFGLIKNAQYSTDLHVPGY